MTDPSAPSSKSYEDSFRIWDVFSRLFVISGRGYRQFFIPTAIIMLPYVAIDWLQSSPSAIDRTEAIILFVLLPTVSGAIIGSIVAVVIVYGIYCGLRGLPISVGKSFGVGKSRILPVGCIAIFQSILAMPYYALMASLIVSQMTIEKPTILIILIVLNIIWLFTASLWYVASSVCVIERLGIVESLKRSAYLTRGHRWKIFAIIILMELGATALETIVTIIARMVSGPAGFIASEYLFQAAYVVFGSIIGVAVYDGLRTGKEGLDSDRLAEVFA